MEFFISGVRSAIFFHDDSLVLVAVMASLIIKMLVMVFVMSYVVTLISALSLQQVKNMMKMPRQMCMQKSGASKALVDKVQTGEFSDDPQLKCYMKCAMGMMQVYKKDNYLAEAAAAQADKLLPDTHKERVKAVIEKCKDAGADITDGCEKAFIITKCNYDADPEVFLFP